MLNNIKYTRGIHELSGSLLSTQSNTCEIKMSYMNSSNSTHGKGTSDLPDMNKNLTGPPYDEYAGLYFP